VSINSTKISLGRIAAKIEKVILKSVSLKDPAKSSQIDCHLIIPPILTSNNFFKKPFLTDVNSASDKAYEETLAKESSHNEETKREETPQDATPKETTKEGDETTKHASQKDTLYQSYVSRYVTNVVDDVCMFYAKVDQVNKKYEGKEEAEKENLQQELNDIPLKSIPLTSDVEDPRYKILRKVKIENEVGTPAGVFGWCFICRSSASLFCKDTKVPVCSLDCKFKHLEEAGKFSFEISESTSKNRFLE